MKKTDSTAGAGRQDRGNNPLFPSLYGRTPLFLGGLALLGASLFLLTLGNENITLLGRSLGFPPGTLFVKPSGINGVDEAKVYRDAHGALRMDRVAEGWVEHAVIKDLQGIQAVFKESTFQRIKGVPVFGYLSFPLVSGGRFISFSSPSALSFSLSAQDAGSLQSSVHISGVSQGRMPSVHISGRAAVAPVSSPDRLQGGKGLSLTYRNNIRLAVFDKTSLPAGMQSLHNFYTELSAFLGLVADQVVYEDYQIFTGTVGEISKVHSGLGDGPFQVASWRLFCDTPKAYVFFQMNWSPQSEHAEEDFIRMERVASSLRVLMPR